MTKSDELMPCREAFEAFLAEKSLSNEKSADLWGQEIYKHHNIESMWYAWKSCWNTRAPIAPSEQRDDGAMFLSAVNKMTGSIKSFLLALKSRPDCIHIWPVLDEMIEGLDEALSLDSILTTKPEA